MDAGLLRFTWPRNIQGPDTVLSQPADHIDGVRGFIELNNPAGFAIQAGKLRRQRGSAGKFSGTEDESNVRVQHVQPRTFCIVPRSGFLQGIACR